MNYNPLLIILARVDFRQLAQVFYQEIPNVVNLNKANGIWEEIVEMEQRRILNLIFLKQIWWLLHTTWLDKKIVGTWVHWSLISKGEVTFPLIISNCLKRKEIIALKGRNIMASMKKDFIVARIEAAQDGSPYVYVGFSDPNDYKTDKPMNPFGSNVMAFTSPEDMMKNLPKAMGNISRMMAGGGASDSPTFKISVREYEDIGIRVGDKVTIEIRKADNNLYT